MLNDFDILGMKQFKSEIQQQIEDLGKDLKISKAAQPPEYATRIADLEVKMAKLWALLVEVTPSNKEKLTKFGRMFGGKARDL